MKFVLLRGLGRESRHWGHFTDNLREKFPHAQIELLDFPGSGKHDDRTAPLSVTSMTDFLRKNCIKGKQKRVLIGVSLGAMVALDWITRYPNDFVGCVLINGSASNLSPIFERLRPQSLAMFAKFLLSKTPIEKEKNILSLTVNSKSMRKKLLPLWTKVHKEKKMKPANSFFQLIAASRFKLSEKPSVPCLVLTSRKDKMVNKRCSEKISRFLEAPLKYHPTAGHELACEDGQWVSKEIESWMSQNIF